MLHQNHASSEFFVTISTLERFLSRVNRHVEFQLGFNFKAFVANRTNMRPVVSAVHVFVVGLKREEVNYKKNQIQIILRNYPERGFQSKRGTALFAKVGSFTIVVHRFKMKFHSKGINYFAA